MQKKRYTILKLPCGHGNVELTKTEDKLIICPVCFRHWVLHWSPIDKYKRIKEIEKRK